LLPYHRKIPANQCLIYQTGKNPGFLFQHAKKAPNRVPFSGETGFPVRAGKPATAVSCREQLMTFKNHQTRRKREDLTLSVQYGTQLDRGHGSSHR
jgi:hypothetical protein